MKYTKLLKTEASEDILNIPIFACDISDELSRIFADARVFVSNKIVPKVATIGDMLALGLNEYQNMVLRYCRATNYLEIIQEGQELLASLGLKFRDSDFTVGDVRVSKLNLEMREKKLVEGLKNIKTLDDLSIYAHYKLVSANARLKTDADLNKIEKAIEEYGLKIDGFKRQTSQDSAFPLDKYEKYLSEKTRLKRCNIESSEIDDVLKKPITVLKLSSSVKSAFYNVGITTIGKLIKKCALVKQNLIHSNIIVIQRELAKLGLKLEGFDYEIENGQAIRFSRAFPDLKVPSVYKLQDLSTLEGEEKEKLLEMTLLDFGVDERVAKLCKDLGVETVGQYLDMDSYELTTLLGGNSNFVRNYLTECFEKYNLITNKTFSSTVYDEKVLQKHILVNKTSEQKEKFREAPLEEIGIQSKWANILRKNNIYSLNDLSKYTIEDIASLFGVKRSQIFKKYLDAAGLCYTPKLKTNNTIDSEALTKSVLKAKDYSMGDIMNLSVDEVGFKEELANGIKNKLKISKIGSFSTMPYSKVVSLLGQYRAKIIAEVLSKYNIKMIYRIKLTEENCEPAEE